MHKFLIYFFSINLFLSLAGCIHPKNDTNIHQTPLLQKVSYSSAQEATCWLKQNHIPIMHIGDLNRIVIPVDYVFEGYSVNLKPQAFSILEQLVLVLKDSSIMALKVKVYTDLTHSDENQNVALTRAQGEIIERYLNKQNLDVRFLSIEAYGSQQAWVSSLNKNAQSFNRRIEIEWINADSCNNG